MYSIDSVSFDKLYEKFVKKKGKNEIIFRAI